MTFVANIHKKFSVWQDLTISFEADNENQARAELEKYNGIPPYSDYLDTETLTEEEFTKEDNSGEEVWELQSLEKSKYE